MPHRSDVPLLLTCGNFSEPAILARHHLTKISKQKHEQQNPWKVLLQLEAHNKGNSNKNKNKTSLNKRQSSWTLTRRVIYTFPSL